MDPQDIDKWPAWYVEYAAKTAKRWLDENKGVVWSDTPRIG